ncbi:MAG: hypothetical protein HYU77_12970 [Betaproteobacteria bacterium]|nr:hypothetical protein [Betaproteobacteria bacterium]
MLDAIITLVQIACIAGLAYGAWLSTFGGATLSQRRPKRFSGYRTHRTSATVSSAA